MLTTITRLWHRLVHCRRGDHRDTHCFAMGIFRMRCVDCGRSEVIGWICYWATNKSEHHHDEP